MVHVSASRVVWIEIRGAPGKDGAVRDDKGLSRRFNRYCLEQEIFTAIRGVGFMGGGCFGGAFAVADVDKIQQFFREEGYDLEITE